MEMRFTGEHVGRWHTTTTDLNLTYSTGRNRVNERIAIRAVVWNMIRAQESVAASSKLIEASALAVSRKSQPGTQEAISTNKIPALIN
jgi:hypothetical protein